MTSTAMSPNHREALTAVSSITGKDEYLKSTNGAININGTIGGSALPISGATTGVGVAILDGSGNQITSFGGGTQYTDGGTPPANPVGGTIEWNEGGTWRTVSTAKPLPVTATFSPSGTQDVNITKIGGNAVTTTVPISGTVTANAGTNLNTSLLALESGGNLASIATNTTNIPNVIGTAAAAIPSKLLQIGGSDGTNARAIKTDTSGNQLVLGTGTAGTASSGVLTIQGIASMTPVQVSQATASNLNATVVGTGTFATQATLQTQTDTTMIGGVNIKEINAVTPLMGNGVTGTGSQRVTIASDNTPFAVKIDQTTPGTTNLVALAANQSVNLAQVGGTNTVNGGVAGSQSVGGTVATNVAITANPINLGAQAVSSENAAVTTARQVQLVADLVGKLIVLPYANPENFVSGVATATDTTSTSLISAPASGLRNYITQITVWNSSATNTYIKIQDGSGGTTLYDVPAPATGGATINLPTPLRQPTTATAIYFAAAASANAVFISASGYKGV